MKNIVLSPLGKCLSLVPMALVIFGCASNINHSAYAVNNDKLEPIIEVIRDSQTADKCKTNFYINETKVGALAAKDVATYQLAPGNYRFTVDNCNGKCSKYGLDVVIKSGEFQKFILSADAKGKPFIIANQSK